MTTSADLGIVYIAGQQAQPEITHNTALNQLQTLQVGVISVALNTPPGSPTQGDTYVIGTSPTGVWAGRANCIAGYFGTGWVFLPGVDSTGTPIAMGTRHEGLKVWNKTDHKLYVWSGSAWAANATGMTNPMTTNQDLIVGGAAGAPGRLGIGTNGFVLTAVAGSVAWAAATGFANPMTTLGDIILGGASGAPGRLAIGTTGQVLTVVSGSPAWATPASGGMANPMTTVGDLILGGAAGAAGRLGIGTTGQVLTVVGGTAAWATAAAGMTNPMTAVGDHIIGGSSGTPTRLAIGTTGQVLTVVSGTAAWATPAGGGGSQSGIASSAASGDDFPFYSGGQDYQSNTINSTTRTQFNVVYLDSALTFTDIVIAVMGGAASSSMDIGIYNFLGAGKPGTCAASANLSTTTAGRVHVTLGSPVALTPGLYFVALHGSSTSPSIASIEQYTGFVPAQLSHLAMSNTFTRMATSASIYGSVLIDDTTLPGGSYTRGMNMTGLNITSSGMVGHNTWVPCVGLTKQ